MNPMNPNTHDAYKLFMDGGSTLYQMSERGVHIDVPYLKNISTQMAQEIAVLEGEIFSTEEGKALKKKHGSGASLQSPKQIAWVLYTYHKIKLDESNESTNDKTLTRIGTDFCKSILQYRKKIKAKTTYIDGIIRQTGSDGVLHASFSLALVSSYRSSSSGPNMQNIPIRDKVIGPMIRKAFYPRKGNMLVEIDYSGAEVRCGCGYHKDSTMIKYVVDPTTDMHRDMASQCYLTPQDMVSKDMRYCGKNMFVFPQFYGDWHGPCATAMWEACTRMGLKLTDDTPTLTHLKTKGMKNLQTFTSHMKEVEKDFWENRFRVYGQWKNELWQSFLKKGHINTLTGFTLHGNFDKKQVCNLPIQGSAFHWLLWSLIKSNRFAIRNGLKSYPILQIHDSMIWDVYPPELPLIARTVRRIMTKDILKKWNWINVPLDVEIDASEIDAPWSEKKEYEEWSEEE